MDNEERKSRGMDVDFLALEQTLEGIDDTELLSRVRELDPVYRQAIKTAASFMKDTRDRERTIKTMSELEPESEAHEFVTQQTLNFAMMRQEVLNRLDDAVTKLEEE